MPTSTCIHKRTVVVIEVRRGGAWRRGPEKACPRSLNASTSRLTNVIVCVIVIVIVLVVVVVESKSKFVDRGSAAVGGVVAVRCVDGGVSPGRLPA